MTPREVVRRWVEAFNSVNIAELMSCYSDNAINYQVPNAPIEGKQKIEKMFKNEFAQAEMVCIVENIFEDGEWAILEWKDPLGLRGCGFFHIINDKVVYQRGYWDKLILLS